MKCCLSVPTAVGLILLLASCDLATSPTPPDVRASSADPDALTTRLPAATLTSPGPECVGARSPGFYCQNQGGKNPNLPATEFQQLAAAAAARLAAAGLVQAVDIATAVCDNKDQLLRHLATLALNLEANLISENTPLTGEPFPTVGAALTAAIAVANNPLASKEERNAVKDVLDRINNNENTILGDECGGGVVE